MPSRDLAALHPSFQPRAAALLAAWEADGQEILVTCTLRSLAEQGVLYAQGRTTPGKIVTKAKPGSSWHNYGLALDAVPLLAGKPAWSVTQFRGLWMAMGRVVREQGLSWGGDWPSFKDYPHVEWHPGLTLVAANRLGYDALQSQRLA